MTDKICLQVKTFDVPEFQGVPEKQVTELCTFLRNGLYYQSIGNAPGALVSYSNAEAYLHLLQELGRVNDEQRGKLQALEQRLLGYIEVLTEKTKTLLKTGGSSGKKDETPEWAEVCKMVPEASKGGITYADVIGLTKEKEEVSASFVKPLLYPNLYPELSKGILLYGPPGTGKTFLVKGMINQLANIDPSIGVIFFSPTGAELKGKYVGETEKNIVKYFTCAARAACANMEESYKAGKPKKYISILFIDEFDNVGGDRMDDPSGLMANSVNTFLQMMDGVEKFKNVSVVAATNYPWKLDAAILRRFNSQIKIPIPAFDDVLELLKYTYKKNIAIKSFNAWCYCNNEIKDLIYKPTTDIGALCTTGINSADVNYYSPSAAAGPAAGPAVQRGGAAGYITVDLPSSVNFKKFTKDGQYSIHYDIEARNGNNCYIFLNILGKNDEYTRFEFEVGAVVDAISFRANHVRLLEKKVDEYKGKRKELSVLEQKIATYKPRNDQKVIRQILLEKEGERLQEDLIKIKAEIREALLAITNEDEHPEDYDSKIMDGIEGFDEEKAGAVAVARVAATAAEVSARRTRGAEALKKETAAQREAAASRSASKPAIEKSQRTGWKQTVETTREEVEKKEASMAEARAEARAAGHAQLAHPAGDRKLETLDPSRGKLPTNESTNESTNNLATVPEENEPNSSQTTLSPRNATPRKGGSRKNRRVMNHTYKNNKSIKPTRIIQRGGGVDSIYKLVLKIKDGTPGPDTNKPSSKWFSVKSHTVQVKDIEGYAPYKFFDLNFLKSPVLREATQIMVEKKYSNSDIDNIMSVISKKAGRIACDNGSFIRYNFELTKSLYYDDNQGQSELLLKDELYDDLKELEKYYVSSMSRLKDAGLYRRLLTEIKSILDTGDQATIKQMLKEKFHIINLSDDNLITRVTMDEQIFYNSRLFPGITLTNILSSPDIDELFLSGDYIDEYISLIKDGMDITKKRTIELLRLKIYNLKLAIDNSGNANTRDMKAELKKLEKKLSDETKISGGGLYNEEDEENEGGGFVQSGGVFSFADVAAAATRAANAAVTGLQTLDERFGQAPGEAAAAAAAEAAEAEAAAAEAEADGSYAPDLLRGSQLRQRRPASAAAVAAPATTTPYVPPAPRGPQSSRLGVGATAAALLASAGLQGAAAVPIAESARVGELLSATRAAAAAKAAAASAAPFAAAKAAVPGAAAVPLLTSAAPQFTAALAPQAAVPVVPQLIAESAIAGQQYSIAQAAAAQAAAASQGIGTITAPGAAAPAAATGAATTSVVTMVAGAVAAAAATKFAIDVRRGIKKERSTQVVIGKRITFTNKQDSINLNNMYSNPEKYLVLIGNLLDDYNLYSTFKTTTFNNNTQKDKSKSELINKIGQEEFVTLNREDTDFSHLYIIRDTNYTRMEGKYFYKTQQGSYEITNNTEDEDALFAYILEIISNYELTESNLASLTGLETAMATGQAFDNEFTAFIDTFFNNGRCIAKFENTFKQDKMVFVMSDINFYDPYYLRLTKSNFLYLPELTALVQDVGATIVGTLASASGFFTKWFNSSPSNPPGNDEEKELIKSLDSTKGGSFEYLITRATSIGAININIGENTDGEVSNFTVSRLKYQDGTIASRIPRPFGTFGGGAQRFLRIFDAKSFIEMLWGSLWVSNSNALPELVALQFLLSKRIFAMDNLKKSHTTSDILNDLIIYTKATSSSGAFSTQLGNSMFVEEPGNNECLNTAYKTDETIDKSLLINFNIPPNLLLPAMKQFPSTYNTTLGNGINSYEADRENFLADRTKWPGPGAKK